LGGLARREARFRRFKAMIDGVADEVRQRFADALDHRFIQFGHLAFNIEPDLLAGFAFKLPDDARHAAENRFDGLRAD
jgi:hypothetical protein